MTTTGARSDQAFPELVVILAGVCAATHVAKLSPALPDLGQSFGVTLLQAGFLLSLVQLAGMLFGLVVGLAADEVGLKRSMVVGPVVLSLASAVGGWAPNAGTLLVLRAIEGVGLLLVAMPAPALIRRLVTPQRMKTMLGRWGAGQWLAVIGFLPSVVAKNGAVNVALAIPLAVVAMVNMVGNIASGRLLQRGVPAHVLLYFGFCTMGVGALVAFASLPGLEGYAIEGGIRYLGILLLTWAVTGICTILGLVVARQVARLGAR